MFRFNDITIVSITLFALLIFVGFGIPSVRESAADNLSPFFESGSGYGPVHGALYATALMFVAYTGYGRIATLGEEVREPRRTIPRAIVLTLVVSAALYIVTSENYPYIDFRVDDNPHPVVELRRIFEEAKKEYIPFKQFLPTAANPAGIYDENVIADIMARQAENDRQRQA